MNWLAEHECREKEYHRNALVSLKTCSLEWKVLQKGNWISSSTQNWFENVDRKYQQHFK